jgi:hypothetical protein
MLVSSGGRRGSPARLVAAALNRCEGRPVLLGRSLRGLAERGVVVPRHYVLSGPGWRDLRYWGVRGGRVFRSENHMCGDKQPGPYLRSAFT